MPHTTPTVFVVDDDVSVRESLAALIQCVGWRAETYSSASAFLARPLTRGECCLLLDIGLPDANGLDVQRRLATDCPELPVVFLTGISDIPMTVRALKAGAVEFLTKPVADDVLIAAIEQAFQISRTLCARAEETEALRRCFAQLTRREREVMASVSVGDMNKRISATLGISEVTVKTHRGRVMRKMKAGSLADLVMMSIKLRNAGNAALGSAR